MERGSLDKLKFDTRLTTRKGWIDDADRDAFADSLPDASDKIAAPEEPPAAEASPATPVQAPAPAAPEPLASTPLNPLSPPFEEVSE